MMLPLVIAVMPEGADRDYMEWLFVEHHRRIKDISEYTRFKETWVKNEKTD